MFSIVCSPACDSTLNNPQSFLFLHVFFISWYNLHKFHCSTLVIIKTEVEIIPFWISLPSWKKKVLYRETKCLLKSVTWTKSFTVHETSGFTDWNLSSTLKNNNEHVYKIHSSVLNTKVNLFFMVHFKSFCVAYKVTYKPQPHTMHFTPCVLSAVEVLQFSEHVNARTEHRWWWTQCNRSVQSVTCLLTYPYFRMTPDWVLIRIPSIIFSTY